MRDELNSVLSAQGVFAGHHGLEGLAQAGEFWERQPYGTRLYYGPGIADYLHRDVLNAAIEALRLAARQPSPSARDVALKCLAIASTYRGVQEAAPCIENQIQAFADTLGNKSAAEQVPAQPDSGAPSEAPHPQPAPAADPAPEAGELRRHVDAQNRISALCNEIEAIAVSFGYDPYEWLMDGGEFGVDERAELAQLRNRSLDLQQALARAQEREMYARRAASDAETELARSRGQQASRAVSELAQIYGLISEGDYEKAADICRSAAETYTQDLASAPSAKEGQPEEKR